MAAETKGIVKYKCQLNFKFRRDDGDNLGWYIDDEV